MSKRVDAVFYTCMLIAGLVLGVLFFNGYLVAKPCKNTVTKPDPRIITHERIENALWSCEPMGVDAKSKYPVFFCTSKHDGAHIEVRYLDSGTKPNDKR